MRTAGCAQVRRVGSRSGTSAPRRCPNVASIPPNLCGLWWCSLAPTSAWAVVNVSTRFEC
eukprot:6179609-Pleurochrysis_carterae.AAC.3